MGFDTLLSLATAGVAVGSFAVGGLAATGRFPHLYGFLVSGTMAALAWGAVGLWYHRRRRSEATA